MCHRLISSSPAKTLTKMKMSIKMMTIKLTLFSGSLLTVLDLLKNWLKMRRILANIVLGETSRIKKADFINSHALLHYSEFLYDSQLHPS